MFCQRCFGTQIKVSPPAQGSRLTLQSVAVLERCCLFVCCFETAVIVLELCAFNLFLLPTKKAHAALFFALDYTL